MGPRQSGVWLLAFGGATVAALLIGCSDGSNEADDAQTPSTTAAITAAPTVRVTAVGSPSPAGASGTASAEQGSPVAARTQVEPGNPASEAEATLAAGLGGEIAGGDPGDPRVPVEPLPTSPPSAAPNVDPTTVVVPDPPDATYQLVVDLDPNAPGIQIQRTARVGDRIRAAVVLANIPADSSVAAFNFEVRYDHDVVIAPSYSGGSSTERNPDLYPSVESWLCLPAPEGDMDDPGGIDGDGVPSTGQAFLSCFAPDAALEGTQVLGTVEFIATGVGTTQLQPAAVAIGNSFAIAIGRCAGDGGDGPEIPCPAATLTIQ